MKHGERACFRHLGAKSRTWPRTFRADTPKYSTSEKMKRVFRKPPGPSSLSDRGRPATPPTEPRRSNTRIEHKKALPDKCGSSSQAIVGHNENLSAHPGAHNAFPTSRRIRSLLPAFSGPKPSCSLSDPDITRFCRNSVKSRKTPFSQADESQDSFQKCLMDHNAPCFLNQTIRKFFVRPFVSKPQGARHRRMRQRSRLFGDLAFITSGYDDGRNAKKPPSAGRQWHAQQEVTSHFGTARQTSLCRDDPFSPEGFAAPYPWDGTNTRTRGIPLLFRPGTRRCCSCLLRTFRGIAASHGSR